MTVHTLIPYAGAPAEVISAYRESVANPAKIEPEPASEPFPIPDEMRGDVEKILAPLRSYSPGIVRLIVAAVGDEFGFTPQQILSQRRHGKLVKARHIAVHIASRLLPVSFPRLGRLFAGRDHSTIYNSLNRAQDMLDGDPELAARVARIEAELYAKIKALCGLANANGG